MRIKDGLVDDLINEVPEKSKAEIEWQKGSKSLVLSTTPAKREGSDRPY